MNNNIYQQASRMKLRTTTERGSLTVDQLWDLPLSAIANGIKSLKKLLGQDKDNELSFLEDTKAPDAETVANNLRFEILKDIYLTRKAENDAARTEREKKEHNQKILALIQDKKEESLKGKSVEELEAMLQ